ncbi:hypothetical protein pipiens_012881 [Culex pipiens pipiens]|uniref:Uncharacterized protein n=1 Tax=Culex pipiens pipiens TaxID=38569 RepID=A0ABD1D0P0_CULPP
MLTRNNRTEIAKAEKIPGGSIDESCVLHRFMLNRDVHRRPGITTVTGGTLRRRRLRSWSEGLSFSGPPSAICQPPKLTQQNGYAGVGGRELDAEVKEHLKLRREENL